MKNVTFDSFVVCNDIYKALTKSNFSPVVARNLSVKYGITDEELNAYYMMKMYYDGVVLESTSIKVFSIIKSIGDEEGLSISEALKRVINEVNKEAADLIIRNQRRREAVRT